MATATGTTRKPEPADEKIYHPLERLRSIIRRYVLIEGVLSVLLFLVAWFTLALILDYGVFKAFGWDWVQDGAYGVRVAALVAAVLVFAGILVFRIARRLMVEFSHSALALVLERRFRKELGDRLITAVELADVEGMAKYGYSKDMIRKTIDEARERVATVPVNEVFNWRRLRVMGLVFVLWVAFLLVFAFAAHAIASGGFHSAKAAWHGIHTTAILAERDLLLMDTPWPRRALIELQGVPGAGIRVARDGAPPRVRVKAYRWVIVDRSRFDGWRPLMWSDVTESLVGVPVPELPAGPPPAGQTRPPVNLPADRSTWTADAILEDAALRNQLSEAMGAEKYGELQVVFARLEELADTPSYGRTLRKLEKPSAVSLRYVGLHSSGGSDLKPEGNNEFAGDVTGLKENVIFSVRAEDYRTPERGITLIPPPALMNLLKVEYQPAYLHYASPLVPADPANPGGPQVPAGWGALKDLRQRMPEEKLSLTGDRTVFVVPVGTEVVITGVAELPIAKAFVKPKVGRVPGAKVTIDKDGREIRSAEPVELKSVTRFEESEGGKTFERGRFVYEFRGADRVTAAVEFDFEFENSDGVKSSRQVLIQVTEDQAPVVEVIPEVIRKVGKEYWVTPRAKIPFNPESNLRDDWGVSKVAYTVTYEPKDAFVVRSLRAATFGRTAAVPALTGDYLALVLAGANYAQQTRSDEATLRKEASFGLGQFAALDANLRRETLDNLKKLASEPLAADRPELVKRMGLKTDLRAEFRRRPDGALEHFRWLVEGDYFDVGALKELEASPGDVQPRYEMQFAVEVTDTNFDTGPKATRHEPITLLVVSEGDLLVEIGKDEDKLGAKLDEALKKLEGAEAKYEFVRQKAERQIPDELEAVKVRAKDTLQDVMKARETVTAVGREFRRIERECVYNQMHENTIATHGRRANRIERANGEFPQAVSVKEDEELRRGLLTPQSTFPAVEKLMGTSQNAFDEGRWADPTTVTNAAIELHKLKDEIAKIRAEIGESQSKERLKLWAQQLLDNQERIKQAILQEQRRIAAIQTAPTPELGKVGPVFMAKGETKKIRQTINWRQYKKDDLVVKVTASDASIVVPAELKLSFETNDIDFEYEVRSGTKEGEFTVTLTPAAGDKVEVKITVK